MRRLTVLLGLATLLATVACAPKETGTLQAATQALGANELKSIEYSGTGKWFQFGQAPSPTLPWPAFDVSSYTASVNYETPAARVQMVRIQVVEPGRVRPAPVPQRPVQVVSGTHAWNMAASSGRRARHRARTPAAARKPSRSGRWRSGRRRTGSSRRPRRTTRRRSRLTAGPRSPSPWAGSTSTSDGSTRRTRWRSVQTSIDNTVLGDTPVEITYSDYRDFERRDVPGQDRADAGRASGAGHHGVEGHGESRGRHRRPGPGAQLYASGGDRRGGEARRRRLLREGRQPSQRRHRPDATTSSSSRRRRTKRDRRRSSRRSRKRFPTSRSAT